MEKVWEPDTCTCVLVFEGLNVPVNLIRVLRTCSEHAGLDGLELATAVHGRNVFKNHVVTSTKESLAVTDEELEWEFKDELLEISFRDVVVSRGDREALQASHDVEFGAGNVRVYLEPKVRSAILTAAARVAHWLGF